MGRPFGAEDEFGASKSPQYVILSAEGASHPSSLALQGQDRLNSFPPAEVYFPYACCTRAISPSAQ
jgi:hypothetical protein